MAKGSRKSGLPQSTRQSIHQAAPAEPPGLMPSISAAAIYSFLKDTRGAVTWTVGDLQKTLKVSASNAARILAILAMQGYVQRKANGEEWLTTSSGETVSGSKFPRFSREAVEKALSTLANRIAAVNRDRRTEFKISKAVAFGDFLSGRSQVQAADVGVELRRRDASSKEEEEDTESKKRQVLKELLRNSRQLHILPYLEWMSERSHQSLI
jgi:hypothetical protein